jgi:hypothetical protein
MSGDHHYDRDQDDVCFDLDSLDRALLEVEALLLIYGGHDEDDDAKCHGGEDNGPLSSARLVLKSSLEEMGHARTLVEQLGNAVSAPAPHQQCPTIALEMDLQVKRENVDCDEKSSTSSTSAKAEQQIQVCLYFGLVPGYPCRRPVSVTVLTAQGRGLTKNKQAQEELGASLQKRANELLGSEALLDLVQACQDQMTKILLVLDSENGSSSTCKKKNEIQENTSSAAASGQDSTSKLLLLSRRWIWVHHITDRQRKLDIVQEARNYQLGGYLKAGYPGIAIVEGPCHACDAFVMWIKGNKSRPGGGFGRQWGHHVRGELIVTERRLMNEFSALEEVMAVLAAACREHDLQDEFKTFVMQHG